LLARPPTVTTTFPVVAPAGTGVTIAVGLQLVGVAAVPLKVTVLVPCVAPKLVPVIVTDVPIGPEVGDKLVMLGAVTVKLTPLLARPPTVTTTLPVVAPKGTAATTLLLLQLVGVAAVPLKVTVLIPCVTPKFDPVIVTDVPIGPEVVERPVMTGGTVTTKPAPLLVWLTSAALKAAAIPPHVLTPPGCSDSSVVQVGAKVPGTGLIRWAHPLCSSWGSKTKGEPTVRMLLLVIPTFMTKRPLAVLAVMEGPVNGPKSDWSLLLVIVALSNGEVDALLTS